MASPAPLPPATDRWLPRRDAEATGALAEAARRAQPVTGAHERVIPVPGPLGELLPGGALRRGAVVAVEGVAGGGASSVALALAAAVTTTGEWAAAIDLGASLGGRAAAEAGVALDRFAVVRPPAGRSFPAERWATAAAVLLDGMSLVIAELPSPARRWAVRAADARRLVARAREREVILVPFGPFAAWPAEVSLRVRAAGGAWPGLDAGSGVLGERTVRVHVEGRGAAARACAGELVLAS
jgi:hypothetical protein